MVNAPGKHVIGASLHIVGPIHAHNSHCHKTPIEFHSRAITDDVLLRNRIDYGSAYMPQLEDHVEKVIFPYFRNGELVNRKYRTINEKHFRLEAGSELVLYGLDDIDPEKPLIWVEGECDKLAIEVARFRHVVSVPNGAPPPGAKN